ncbi:uncharacterized protein LOC106695227 [Myotis lucifugus]|uniref:uncharacterized protein LOC106695227 n=1 Tax=Myotis lucifugus TaxID=59463 RepID=UPI000CCC52B7|nr:uncharacterized protein LOC106695227 [Myotis lucifugus]
MEDMGAKSLVHTPWKRGVWARFPSEVGTEEPLPQRSKLNPQDTNLAQTKSLSRQSLIYSLAPCQTRTEHLPVSGAQYNEGRAEGLSVATNPRLRHRNCHTAICGSLACPLRLRRDDVEDTSSSSSRLHYFSRPRRDIFLENLLGKGKSRQGSLFRKSHVNKLKHMQTCPVSPGRFLEGVPFGVSMSLPLPYPGGLFMEHLLCTRPCTKRWGPRWAHRAHRIGTLTQPADEYPSRKRLDDKNDGLGATIGGACGWGTFWVVSGDLLAENEPGWGKGQGWKGAGQGGPPGDLELGGGCGFYSKGTGKPLESLEQMRDLISGA